ncbi:HNH endonuclease [Serratia fonticola]|uniref:HNH endonuclease signature motif containing protein n=1 Tax=Serratia fonticola TaxID=47917 RepID=UPI003986908F
MFYPKLNRVGEYKVKNDKSFYSYAYYRDVVEKDCLQRCVYCDVLLVEHAYEGMHLDHFRPQKHFKELASDPRNLVLTCPKCNRLKSCHWPCDKDPAKPPHDNKNGFVDPFSEDIKEYIRVEDNGMLQSLKGPAPYFITLLKLNRESRIQIRRRRIINLRKNKVMNKLLAMSDELIDLLISQGITRDAAIQRKNEINIIKHELEVLDDI